MGLYSRYIFPFIMDSGLGSDNVREQRLKILPQAVGEVLEIGFGTGLNLPYYTEKARKLSVLDSEKAGLSRIKERIAASKVPVEQFHLDASNRLPFADNQFDTVVTTFTLCSIADLSPALAEIRRVLKPEGRYLFLEHGRSDNPSTAKWQDRFNPIQKIVGCGCNINRPISEFIKEAGLTIVSLDRFALRDVPRIMGEMYRGIASPNK
ncbi:MAG TPA: class I SAM-dependent methyltransferase [Blastocatellia bacterium]|nr:class I SAM-dependent methyltransferase [Blastocatellia bacterium]